jgi:hypothetical protein
MQSGFRWSRSHSRRRFPVVGTPYAPPSARPCGYRGGLALVRRCALCGRSVVCGQSCGVCPRPPLCFAAARHQPCALVCPSAPRGGSLSPRAFAFGFCYKFRSCLRTKYGGLLLHANQSGSNRVSAFLHVGRPVPAILLHHDALFDDALYCLDAFHHAANGFIALGVTGIK